MRRLFSFSVLSLDFSPFSSSDTPFLTYLSLRLLILHLIMLQPPCIFWLSAAFSRLDSEFPPSNSNTFALQILRVQPDGWILKNSGDFSRIKKITNPTLKHRTRKLSEISHKRFGFCAEVYRLFYTNFRKPPASLVRLFARFNPLFLTSILIYISYL